MTPRHASSLGSPPSTLCLAASLLVAAGLATADESPQTPEYLFKGAKPLALPPPVYPRNVLRDGGEGWVKLNFVIDPTGKPTDIVVTDSAGAAPLRSAAKRAVKQWSFEPATLDGKPVLQCRNRYIITFKTDPPASGASSAFVARYRRANRALAKGNVESARKIAAELKAIGVNNFHENAAYWYLRLQLASRDQDMRALRHAAGRVVALGPGHLPEDATRQAALIRYKLLVETNLFAQAEGLRAKFADYGIDDDDASLAPYHARLHAARTQIPAYGVKGRISEDWWSIALFKPSFYLDDVRGHIRDIEIRCTHHRESAAEQSTPPDRVARRLLYEEKAWVVPSSWGGDCHVMVHGDQGTEFTLVQQSLASTS